MSRQLPKASNAQQRAFQEDAEQLFLLFCANCIVQENYQTFATLIKAFTITPTVSVRPELLHRLQSSGTGTPTDFNLDFANSLRVLSTSPKDTKPQQVFEFAFKTYQLAHNTGQKAPTSAKLRCWIEQKWKFVWGRQRFLLADASLFTDGAIEEIGNQEISEVAKITEILKVLLPTLKIPNEAELKIILDNSLK